MKDYTFRATRQVSQSPDLLVTVQDLEQHIRIDSDSETALVEALVRAATEVIAKRTRRSLVESQYELTLDDWPLSLATTGRREIRLDFPPIVSVDGVFYKRASDGAEVELDAATYTLDAAATPGRIVFTSLLPSVKCGPGAIRIAYTAGNAAVVPERVRLAVRMLAAHYYAHREEVADVALHKVPEGVDALISDYKVPLI